MSIYESPSAIIADFRISDPSEIDMEAIAQSRGATIIYETLHGCAARILGNGDQAIITIDDGPNVGRRRFSAAHEFGHWMRDRAKIRFSCTEQAMQNSWVTIDTERGANEYAADFDRSSRAAFGMEFFSRPFRCQELRYLRRNWATRAGFSRRCLIPET